jgi:hypothetical protein
VRLGPTTTVQNIGNRVGSWRFATSLLVLTIVLLTASPIATIAQGEGLATSGATAEGSAPEPAEQVVPVVEQPTSVPVPPTAVPPTAVPPTAVPPTAVPPTAIPTAVPTEIPPTAVPTQEPTAVPTEQVWVNTDTLRVTDGVTAYTVQQGASATVAITYTVTTPRTSTTLYARLSGGADGWAISSPQLPDADPTATTAVWTEAATLQPGTAFTLPIVITAPATVAQDHAVSLHLWSVAAGEKGQETGIAKTDLRFATITALAPPPTPTPTIEPTIIPTEEPSIPATPEIVRRTGVSSSTVGPSVNSTDENNICRLAPEYVADSDGYDLVGDDGYVKYDCRYSTGPIKFQWGPGGLTAGWSVSLTGLEGDFSAQAPGDNLGSNNQAGTFSVYVKPQSCSEDTVSGSLDLQVVNVTKSNANKDVYQLTQVLRFRCEPREEPVVAAGEDIELTCAENEAITLVPGESRPISCTYTSKVETEVDIKDIVIAGPAGWTLAPDPDGETGGELVEGTLSIPNGPTGVKLGNPQAISFLVTAPFGCIPEPIQSSITITSSFTYVGAESNIDTAPTELTMTASSNASGDVQPTVSMADFDFDDTTWDGQKWPTTYGTGVIKPTRTGCGDLGEYQVQVKVRQSPDGIRPSIDSVSVPEGASATGIYADPNEQPVTVATIDGQFTEGNISVTFELTPDPEVPAGTHNMTFEVTTLNVQD